MALFWGIVIIISIYILISFFYIDRYEKLIESKLRAENERLLAAERLALVYSIQIFKNYITFIENKHKDNYLTTENFSDIQLVNIMKTMAEKHD